MKQLFITSILLSVFTLAAFTQDKIENLKIIWPEEYKWKIGSNQEDGAIHVMELIPEKDKLEKWTIMGNMMSIKGAKNVPLDNLMITMFDQAKQNAPKATVTLIEKNEAAKNHWIIFKIELRDLVMINFRNLNCIM